MLATTWLACSGNPPYASTEKSWCFATPVSSVSSERSWPSRFCSTMNMRSCVRRNDSTSGPNGNARTRR